MAKTAGRDYQAIREQIWADPSTDYKEVARKYNVSVGFVYVVWGEKSNKKEATEAAPS
jgi:DNA invertase Pin-like site-specific DNA recombinase